MTVTVDLNKENVSWTGLVSFSKPTSTLNNIYVNYIYE